VTVYSLFFLSLTLTLLSETGLLLFLIRKYFKIKVKKIPSPRLLFAGFLASFSTLPYLWFILPTIISSYSLYTIIGEFFVVATETIIYHFTLNLNFKKSFTLSLLCNLFSFLLGKIIL